MSLSNKEYPVAQTFVLFGRLDVNVTLLAVIVQVNLTFLLVAENIGFFKNTFAISPQICNHQMRMVGSGRDLVRKLDQPVNVIPAIGHTLVDMVRPNLTIAKLPKETTNHVYRF